MPSPRTMQVRVQSGIRGKLWHRCNAHSLCAGEHVYFAKGSNYQGGFLVKDSGTKTRPIFSPPTARERRLASPIQTLQF